MSIYNVVSVSDRVTGIDHSEKRVADRVASVDSSAWPVRVSDEVSTATAGMVLTVDFVHLLWVLDSQVLDKISEFTSAA